MAVVYRQAISSKMFEQEMKITAMHVKRKQLQQLLPKITIQRSKRKASVHRLLSNYAEQSFQKVEKKMHVPSSSKCCFFPPVIVVTSNVDNETFLTQ